MSFNGDIAEELTKLAKLDADGALSDEEFKTLKARFISQGFEEQPRINPAAGAPPRQTAHVQETRNKPISDWASWCLALVPIISLPISAILISATDSWILPYMVPMSLWLLFLLSIETLLEKGA